MNNQKYLCECLSYSNQTCYLDAPLYHLSVYQSSRQSDNPFPLYGNFMKRRENKPIFGSSYLRNTCRDLVEIWNGGYWGWRASPQQKLSGFVQAAWSYYVHKNCIIVLPVNILTGMVRQLLGQHNTLPCVFYLFINYLWPDLGHPHTSNIPTLTINNFRWQSAIPLKFGQQCVPT